jgi:hypothetical protein
MAKETICIRCPHASFLDPRKDIRYKTGGLFCERFKEVVGKYDACRIRTAKAGRGNGGKRPKP